ncbi:nitroreductase/quinone reductase family protein [Pseudonocardia lacus]|uniref:nitroreductase/quinone reductase family protein n=1 Tax=Pseudonocardia lacus TaxID=2835865 RepID=UPI00202940F0|nr:nitroreductase/quinone reductase family protein [Pseudonocardia lacus]
MGTMEQGGPASAVAPDGWYARLMRRMYRGGRPGRAARLMNRPSELIGRWGLLPSRLVSLEVVGRRSGRVVSLPLVPVRLDGEVYLVSMLGEANWVRNVRAAGGEAVLEHGRRDAVRLLELPVEQRAPIIARYLELAPGGRPHLPVRRGAPLAEIAAVADAIPVFRVVRR